MISRSFLKLLLLLLLPFFLHAEDAVADDAVADDAVTDDAAADDDESSRGGSSMEICSDSDIEVTAISLLCDSPGTFYYGSGKYRNNVYCKSGDKAKLSIYFDVVGDLSEVDPLLTLQVSGDSETAIVYKNARLCYLGTLSSTDGSSCGGYGSFSVTTQFYWGSGTDDDYSSQQSFAPYVTVGFHSERDPNKYDLGGVNTDMCSGNTFLAWSDTIKESGNFSGPLASIVWSSVVLVGTLVILGMFAWYLWKRPFANQDSFARYYDESVDEDRKITLIRNHSGLVDFWGTFNCLYRMCITTNGTPTIICNDGNNDKTMRRLVIIFKPVL